MSGQVIVIDDHESVRRSLRALLESDGFSVLEHPSAESFLSQELPDGDACLLLDFRMPGMNGLDLQDELARRGARIPVVLLTAHGDVSLAVKAMRAGAVDVLEKPTEDNRLIQAIRTAMQEGKARSLDVEPPVALDSLTARERQVLGQLGQGKSNKLIAAALDISPRTVEIHRSNIQKKLNAQCLADLIKLARQSGLA